MTEERIDAPYRLDVTYPLDQFESGAMDAILEKAVGIRSDSSGGGIGGMRDMQFWFTTSTEREAAAHRVGSIADWRIDTIQRTDLDPETVND